MTQLHLPSAVDIIISIYTGGKGADVGDPASTRWQQSGSPDSNFHIIVSANRVSIPNQPGWTGTQLKAGLKEWWSLDGKLKASGNLTSRLGESIERPGSWVDTKHPWQPLERRPRNHGRLRCWQQPLEWGDEQLAQRRSRWGLIPRSSHQLEGCQVNALIKSQILLSLANKSQITKSWALPSGRTTHLVTKINHVYL